MRVTRFLYGLFKAFERVMTVVLGLCLVYSMLRRVMDVEEAADRI